MTLLVLCAVLTPLTGWAAPAAAAQPHDAQARYFAEQLRRSPVHISDQVPRTVPRSARPAFAAQAERTGVPTYVLVLPFSVAIDGKDLLSAVHDRLGRKGLYVLLEADGGGGWGDIEVMTYAVRVPADRAAGTAKDWLPDDATALDLFTRFVDGLRNGGDASGGGWKPGSLYTSPGAREVQSAVTGALTVVIPFLVLLLGVRSCPRHRGSRGWLWLPLLAAAALALIVPLGARAVFGDTRSTGDPAPTARDMRLRIERVATGLRESPVYVDAESVPALSPAQRRSLAERLHALDVPVRVVVLPLHYGDESYGRAEAFAERLHETLGQDGVYVVAHLGTFDRITVRLANHGAKLADTELHDLDAWVRFGPEAPDEGPALHRRLMALADHIADTPQGPPGRPDAARGLPDPVADDTVPPLLSGPFRSVVRAGAAGAGALCAAWGAVLGVRRARRGGRARAHARADAPTAPHTAWLRRTARRELALLHEDFVRLGGTGGDRVHGHVWDCLDAATLLLDQRGDQRVDADARDCDLATALVLIRAGQAVVRSAEQPRVLQRTARVCTLNPLHGPAGESRRLTPSAGARDRRQPVCTACAAALPGRAPDGRRDTEREVRLRLPGPDGTVAYTELPGPLGTAGSAGEIVVRDLIRDVKEQLGVHG
ncbi:hypothetical protein KBZ10_09215 [Streptomyces sp. F63]|uniref:hypothetical protein n=1 Tax=Streptomyces sp. F63 TaxID=2824887 RepID=UPI001B35EBB6|nr:hypothetical protein [Streptomyces sp. F63]MBQ0984692.1 hypothetical protein [Streptomyces sp. F63]